MQLNILDLPPNERPDPLDKPCYCLNVALVIEVADVGEVLAVVIGPKRLLPHLLQKVIHGQAKTAHNVVPSACSCLEVVGDEVAPAEVVVTAQD